VINPDNYEYLCKLDLDLLLPRRYFEILIDKMTADPRIATCSGKAYSHENGRMVAERHGDYTSLGKILPRACFKAIGGFVREVMWDGIDCPSSQSSSQASPVPRAVPVLDRRVTQFQDWLRQHRGISERTIDRYGRMVMRLLPALTIWQS
jgi:hypothetical protein